MMKPTIYEVLCTKLGRTPTHTEIIEDVKRILREGGDEAAVKGKIPRARRGARK